MIGRIVRETLEEWWDDEASRHAATLAFYALLSIAPLLVVLVAVVGLVFGDDAARGDVARQLRDILGREASRGIEDMIARSRSSEQGIAASIVSPIVLLFGASSVFGELQSALDAIWGVRLKPGRGIRGEIADRFASFGMVIGVAVLLLVSVVARSVVPLLTNSSVPEDPGLALLWEVANSVLSFASVTVFLAVLFKIVPHARIAWREVWVGAAVTAALLMFGRFALGMYFAHTTIASPHGAAGSLFVLVLWVYYSAQILFLGAEFTQVYARHLGATFVPTKNAVRIPISEPSSDETSRSARTLQK